MHPTATHLLPLLPALVLSATAAEWGTDYASALLAARQQGKAVLVDFTGSDWCHFCIRLRNEVLDHPDFAAWATGNFVLLEVDVPQNPNFDPRQLEQNRSLCTRYAIEGFPTVLVLDSRGRALGGIFGYEPDRAAMRSAFEKGLQADRLLQQAAKLEGEAKLQPLLAAWQLIPEELRKLNKPLQQEILALDTQDLSGLRAEAAAKQALKECMAAEAAAPTDAAALDIVNAALAQAVPANRRQLLELKYRLLMRSLETHEDVYAAAEVAYAAIDADLRLTPRQKENRKRQLRAVFANPQTALNRSKTYHRNRPKK